MKNLLMIAIAALAFLGTPTNAAAAEKLTADQILDRMDQRINGNEDSEMDVRLTAYKKDGSSKAYTFNIMQKGKDRRLIRFNSGEIKGMSILTENQNRVYVYLPGYKKVRRVASHNMNQALVGSQLSNADMATSSYAEVYTATIEKEEEGYWYLRLIPKDLDDSTYGSLLMKVGKGTFLLWAIDFSDKKGTLVKQFISDKLKNFDGIDSKWHSLLKYVDVQTGDWTTLEVLTLKLDQGLKKSLFTTRQLQWGR